MFIQLILLPLFLFQFPYISANRYGAYCNSDSDCDQNQKCSNRLCRCNMDERRFWTGKMCAICATEYTVTIDRCYKSFDTLKTWTAARDHCRAQYADLFTWRNNDDEQFIRPVVQQWVNSNIFLIWSQIKNLKVNNPYLAWAGATITSLNPFTTKWVDPDGIQLNLYSREWCDPTKDAGYLLQKEPTSGIREGPNGTEREECVTYNFGGQTASLLCLADDYCNQKYPFICEMNTASMTLANSVQHGSDIDTLSGTGGGNINFENPPPPPPPEPVLNTEYNGSPSALVEKGGILSKLNIRIFIGVGIVLIIGAIAGYLVIKKKKQVIDDNADKDGGGSQNRPSFASSIGSIMDE